MGLVSTRQDRISLTPASRKRGALYEVWLWRGNHGLNLRAPPMPLEMARAWAIRWRRANAPSLPVCASKKDAKVLGFTPTEAE